MTDVDASIYQNVKPLSTQTPSIMESAHNAMSLANLGMQNQQMQLQMQTQQAMRSAYANNIDQTGNLNQQGFLKDLGQANPVAAMQYQQQFSQMAKQKAELQSAQADAANKTLTVTGPAFDYLAKLPEDQRAAAYSKVVQQLKDQGIDTTRMDHPYDPGLFQQYYSNWRNSEQSLKNQVAQTTIGKNTAETAKAYADIGKVGDTYLQSFKDDLDPNKARGGNLAKSQSVVNAADRLNAMFQQFPDYNIPKAQQTELISAFGAMLNGGSAPLQSQLEDLVPKSARGDAKAMASWVMNDPLGADQQKFMQMLHESVGRERDVADTQVKTAQVQRISSHQQLFRSNPQGAMSVLNSYGINPEDIKNGKYVPSQKNQGSNPLASDKNSSDLVLGANAGKSKSTINANDAQALQWLKTTDPSDPTAFKVRAKLKAKGIL